MAGALSSAVTVPQIAPAFEAVVGIKPNAGFEVLDATEVLLGN
jgi:hypothetical protein